jgi:hypothetical protein
MSARHENREPGWFDTTPFFCYRRGGIVPDQSKSRTPIGGMTNEEIYGPFLRKVPACSGLCKQRGGKQCKNPEQCQLQMDRRALFKLAGLCAGVWVVIGFGGWLIVKALT